MSDSVDGFRDRFPLLQGAVAGAFAYVASYVATYALVSVDSNLSPASVAELGTVEGALFDLGFPRPEPTTFEFVGWVLHNAHFVETVFAPDIPTTADADATTGAESRNILDATATAVPELVYHLVPVIFLAVGGYLLARRVDVTTGREAAGTGATLLAGYAPLALVGTLLFTATATGERATVEATVAASPALGMTLVAAVVFPLLFGTAGALLARRNT